MNLANSLNKFAWSLKLGHDQQNLKLGRRG